MPPISHAMKTVSTFRVIGIIAITTPNDVNPQAAADEQDQVGRERPRESDQISERLDGQMLNGEQSDKPATATSRSGLNSTKTAAPASMTR